MLPVLGQLRGEGKEAQSVLMDLGDTRLQNGDAKHPGMQPPCS